jgi:predicted dehydrogenase
MAEVGSVAIVGLGTIARTHATVLRTLLPSASVVGVDPRGTEAAAAGETDRVVTSIDDAPDVDLWVVATPTYTHASLAARLLTRTTGLVLVEKPLVSSVAELEVLDEVADRDRLRVAHHFAYSPEVRWAVSAAAGFGAPRRIVSVFHDPYVRKTPEELTSYGSAWTDSGPNQLSMLLRWVDDVRIESVEDDGHRGVASGTVSGDGTVTLVASWRAADSSKRTVLSYADDVEVWLDHTAVTGVVLRGGRPVAWLENDGATPRKIAHYRPLYEALLSGKDDALLRYDAGRRVVQQLRPGS